MFIEFEVQFEYVDSSFPKEAKLPVFGVLVNQRTELINTNSTLFRDTRQLELSRGGYISIFDPSSGWTQVNAKGDGGPRILPGSRRQRRKLIKPAWRRSLL